MSSAKPKKYEGVKRFWVGSFKQIEWNGETVINPRGCIHLGGLDFPVRNAVVPISEGMNLQDKEPHDGQIKEITHGELMDVYKSLESKVVRRQGSQMRVLSTDSSRFKRRGLQPTDIPLAAFCYIVELPEDVIGHPTVMNANPDPLIPSPSVAAE
jgi:hypothetical protein